MPQACHQFCLECPPEGLPVCTQTYTGALAPPRPGGVIMIRRIPRPLFALSLALLLAASALGDTIRLKDGQVIRGQIVSFRDQQFTVLIGSGAGGRRSRVTVYIDDVDSIEFDSAGSDADASPSTGG